MQNRNYSNVIQIILIIALCGSYAFSQSEDRSNFLKEIQTSFNNPTGVISLSERVDNSLPIQYLVRTEQEILFCDKDFKVVKSKNIDNDTKIVISKSSKYLLLERILSIYSKDIELIDNCGNEYWSKTVPLEEEEYEVTCYPTDYDGNVIILDHHKLTVTTISNTGKMLNKSNLFDQLKSDRNKKLLIDISKSGKYFTILSENKRSDRKMAIRKLSKRDRLGTDPEKDRTFTQNDSLVKFELTNIDTIIYNEQISGEPTLFLFNQNGEILKKIQVEEERPSRVFINGEGSRILYTVEDLDSDTENYLTVLVDEKFNKIFSKSFSGYPRMALFDTNSIYLYYYDTINKVFKLLSLDLLTGRTIFESLIDNYPCSIQKNDDVIELVIRTAPTYSEPSKKYWKIRYDKYGYIKSEILLGEIDTNRIYTINNSEHYSKNNFVSNCKIYQIIK